MNGASRSSRGWLDAAEVGSLWGIRFVVGLCRLFGRGAARGFLRLLVSYYVAFHRRPRAASRAYLARLRGVREAEVPLADVYRHFCRFADVALDRLLIAAGRYELFEVRSHGREHLDRLVEERRGALLLGAHLGSFEAMRLGAVTQAIPVNMVVNFSNARRMQAVFDRLDPAANTRFIPATGQPLDFVLRIRECIERGELVAILADRVASDGRTSEARFLGGGARFPTGPFILAAALHCPVYLTFGLYRGDNRYDLYCEPFAERIDLPRKGREQALSSLVQRYAERLEAYARMAPDNWFNFYPFWSTS